VFSEPIDGDVTITLYDILGNAIRTINTTMSIAGEQSVTINATDDQGGILPAGAYTCVAEATSQGSVRFRAVVKLQVVK
jgi:flagellar hook assembly protein FlgD